MEESRISKICDVLSPEEIAILEEHRDIFKGHRCVANARQVYRLIGYECVEGFILAVLDDIRDMRYCKHCWNMTKDGRHFDVTAEYCFPRQPDEIHYTAMMSCNEKDYLRLEKEYPTWVFCSKSVSCVAELNFDADMYELKKLEKAVLGDNSKEAFTQYRKKFCETIESLLCDLSSEEKPRYQRMANDIMNDITPETTTGRLQELESLKNAVLPNIR